MYGIILVFSKIVYACASLMLFVVQEMKKHT